MIGTIRSDGVITVHDGPDGTEKSDVFSLDADGVAAARIAFVMEPGDVNRDGGNAVGLFENIDAAGDVTFHESEFFFCQLARLVDDIVRDFHFADVMQQRAKPEQVQLLVRKIQMTTEGEREHAHAQTVERGVFVLVLELVEAHERIRVADDAVDHVGNDFFCAAGVDAAAETHILHDVVDGLAGLGHDDFGLTDFFVDRC